MAARGIGPPGDERLDGLKVLLVEDEAIIAFDLECILAELGCKVIAATSSIAEALAVLRSERPDIALLDLGLPDGWALPVAKALAESAVPFAIMSGHARSEIKEPSLRDAYYLGKPYGRSEVQDVIERLKAALPRCPSDRSVSGPAAYAASKAVQVPASS
jgi:DNA-binding response OmpR family regulator